MFSELEDLGKNSRDWLSNEFVPESQQKISHEVDVRYYRQGHEISLGIELDDIKTSGLEYIKNRFNEIHNQTYGFQMETSIEIVNIRAIAIGIIESAEMPSNEAGEEDASRAITDPNHEAYFSGHFIKTPIYDRKLLKSNNRIDGPAIIVQNDSTTLLLPNNIAVVDEYMNLIINEEGGSYE